MKRRYHTIRFASAREARPVEVVGDAAIAAGPIAEGRAVPLLILDTSDRPDLEELIRIHQEVNPGDVQTQWAQLRGKAGTVCLLVEFERPLELSVLLEFTIEAQGGLVDLILRSRGFYLQGGRKGDRLITTRRAPRILVEVPKSDFGPIWEQLLMKSVTATFRQRGLKRAAARQAARGFITEWRRVGNLRMPMQSGSGLHRGA